MTMTMWRLVGAMLRCGLLPLVIVLGGPGTAQAIADVQPIPALTAHVIDQTGALTTTQSQALENRLTALQTQRGSQLVILLVATTQPEDIAAYAQRVGDAWKIGRKDVGDGLLIVVAKQDHTVRIEVAKALEGAIPDLAAKRIIDQSLTPSFKAGDFSGGLTRAVDQIDQLIAGEHLPEPASPTLGERAASHLSGDDWLGILGVAATVVFVLLSFLAKLLSLLLGDTLGLIATHLLVGGLAWWLSGSWVVGVIAIVIVAAIFIWGTGFSGGSFGGNGSSSGGGFSSGGGGDFGGGGASGKW